jgi:ABC-2 type transport system permease protein
MTLTRALWVARKEWKETFNSPMPYIVFRSVFPALGLVLYRAPFFWREEPHWTGSSVPLPLILSIFMPALTLRLFAEEFRSGTIETLGDPAADRRRHRGLVNSPRPWPCGR